jgi:hypothetical protein
VSTAKRTHPVRLVASVAAGAAVTLTACSASVGTTPATVAAPTTATVVVVQPPPGDNARRESISRSCGEVCAEHLGIDYPGKQPGEPERQPA